MKKKVRYVARMVVEFEVDEEFEKFAYPNGLNKDTMVAEMKTDNFHEFFLDELLEYEAEGFIIENGEVVASHKQVMTEIEDTE